MQSETLDAFNKRMKRSSSINPRPLTTKINKFFASDNPQLFMTHNAYISIVCPCVTDPEYSLIS